ncbi:MAG: metallophosphoesterase [Candidatus Thorarchaeota archaeon]|nr:metallophosphoesterase [Candidatus Thorarchaeota archaeon]
MTIRIAHISDTHLGSSPREGVRHNIWGVENRIRLLENDFYERFRELFDKIAALDPPVDLVIHSGDLYDTPTDRNHSQPPVVAQETAITVLNDFISRTGIPVLVIDGNHGVYRNRDVSLLDLLRISVPGLKVATLVDMKRALREGTPLKFSFDEFDVFCFPYIDRAVLESADYLPQFEEWITDHQQPDSARPSIAVAHGMELDRSLYHGILSHPYDYIALGHDHRMGKLAKNAWYAGSPERWRFDESNLKKGFLLVEIEHGVDPVVTPQLLDFKRPVFNEQVELSSKDTPSTAVNRVRDWLTSHDLMSEWNDETAARVRLILTGDAPSIRTLELTMELEALRSEVLREGSGYNIAQFVWSFRLTGAEWDEQAHIAIESEYLIEDPETDFKKYLETIPIDEKYDVDQLTRLAVRALRIAVSRTGEKLSLDTLEEEEV